MARKKTTLPSDEMSLKYGMIGAAMIGIFLVIAFIVGRQTNTPTTKPVPSSEVAITKKEVTLTKIDTKEPPKVAAQQGWKRYTARDPQYGFETTLNLPPDFSFQFSGSEFTIQSGSPTTEQWIYQSSIFNGKDGVKNYYTGQSRRVWYQSYLSRQYSAPDNYLFEPDQILSVEEFSLNKGTYLGVKVNTAAGIQTHYLFVQNMIVHIFAPASDKASSPEAKLPTLLPQVLESLSSKEI